MKTYKLAYGGFVRFYNEDVVAINYPESSKHNKGFTVYLTNGMSYSIENEYREQLELIFVKNIDK